MAAKLSPARTARKPRTSGTNRASRNGGTEDLSKQACLVIDHGVFVEFALRLAREGGFGTVYYCDPTWQQAFSIIDHAVIGDGYRDDPKTPMIRVKEPWKLIDKGLVNCVIFPDVHRCEEQEHIASLGMPVWGARHASLMETNKWRFKQIQHELGMKHADYDLIEGLDKLREYCQDPKNNDRWIKITPQFRGNKETFHHVNYDQSRRDLAEMELEFGILGSILKFLAEHPLKGKLEGGLDTYSVDGAHPLTVVSGWEKKDHGYFAEVLHWDELTEELREAVEPLFPLLKKHQCRQMLSTEVMLEDRVLLEPTIREASPAGEEQMELYKNFPQIIRAGADGILLEPDVDKKFACEAMVEHTGDDNHARELEVPDEERQWVKLYNICKVGKKLWTAPGCNIIGAVVGIGDTPSEALEHLKNNAKALKDQPVKVHLESIPALIEEIEEAKSQGKGFKGAVLPDLAEAVES